ncbi:hypothetical protein TNCV_2399321 [Trichonephila clavipes]|uniref:Uncharacterized protein n=1 Tax=Trichonephila clavipes TaxID=2585209 RepID=A0A8X6VRX1_TRICX|nr:hypothetical protein TNCV_2399321 [Trichonephila clavipes]
MAEFQWNQVSNSRLDGKVLWANSDKNRSSIFRTRANDTTPWTRRIDVMFDRIEVRTLVSPSTLVFVKKNLNNRTHTV